MKITSVGWDGCFPVCLTGCQHRRFISGHLAMIRRQRDAMIEAELTKLIGPPRLASDGGDDGLNAARGILVSLLLLAITVGFLLLV